MSVLCGQRKRYGLAKIIALANLLVLGGAGGAMAQFGYPVWPATYRLYYANQYSNRIGTAVISFSTTNDAMRVLDEASLFSASNPSALTLCGDDLYWIELGHSLYRGKKTGSGAAVLVKDGLGGFASDVVVRGGAIYISGYRLGADSGILKTDLNGTSLQFLRGPEAAIMSVEKVGLNLLGRDVFENIYAFSCASGATNRLV